MLQAFTTPSPATPSTTRRTSVPSDGSALSYPAMQQRCSSDAAAMQQRCSSDHDSNRWTSRKTSGAGAMSRTNRQTRDARVTEEQPDQQQTNRQTNRQTRDARVTDEQADEQATDHESNRQTRERRTMDEETRQLYHRRLERIVEIAVNSNYSVCFTVVIHTEEEELHSHKLRTDRAPIDDGIDAIPHGLDAITTISSINLALLPFQSLFHAQPIDKSAMHCNPNKGRTISHSNVR